MPFELTSDEVKALAEAGAAAPSGGNVQPWRLVAGGAELVLRVDPERAGGLMDVGGSASILALGAFAENVAVASGARGLSHRIETESDPQEGFVARIVYEGRGEPDAEAARLAEAIATRATNRRAWNGEVVGDAQVAALAEAVASAGRGCALRAVASEPEKTAVVHALAEADVVRTFNARLRAEMMSEMRWTPEEARETADGVDVATLELPSSALGGFRMMRSSLFVTLMVTRNRMRTMSRAALAASSHLACITIPREITKERLFDAGRAVERAWLRATALGLWIQPWSVAPFFALRAEREPEVFSPKELETLRAVERSLAEAWAIPKDERPIFTFRLFAGDPPSARALRRPWESFTVVR